MDILRYSRILTIGAIFTVLLFFVMKGSFVTWNIETKYIISPHTQITAQTLDQITHNIAQIPLSNNFKLDLEKSVSDAVASIRTTSQVLESSSIVVVTHTGPDLDQERTLAIQSRKIFYGAIGSYYDVRNDIHVRSFDAYVLTKNLALPWLLTLISLAGGFSFSLLLDGIIVRASMEITRLYQTIRKSKTTQALVSKDRWWESYTAVKQNLRPLPKKKKRSQPQEITPPQQPEKEFTPKRDASNRALKTTGPKISSAPSNLPIIEEKSASPQKPLPPVATAPSSLPIVETASPPPQDLPIDTSPQPSAHSEPTEEELKKKLNKLLQGDL